MTKAAMKKVPAFWLEPHVVDKLRHLRGPGESCSDVIRRLRSGAAVSMPAAARFELDRRARN